MAFLRGAGPRAATVLELEAAPDVVFQVNEFSSQELADYARALEDCADLFSPIAGPLQPSLSSPALFGAGGFSSDELTQYAIALEDPAGPLQPSQPSSAVPLRLHLLPAPPTLPSPASFQSAKKSLPLLIVAESLTGDVSSEPPVTTTSEQPPIPPARVSRVMVPELVSRISQQKESRQAAVLLEQHQQEIRINQKKCVEIYIWYQDGLGPNHFAPMGISDYPFLNLATSHTHYDSSKALTIGTTEPIVNFNFALDSRVVLLRIPGVKDLVLKRTWKVAMDGLDPDLLKQPAPVRASSLDPTFLLPSSDIKSGSDDSFEKSFADFLSPFTYNSNLPLLDSSSSLPSKPAQSTPFKPSKSLPVAKVIFGDSELDCKRQPLYAEHRVYTGEATSISWPQGMTMKDIVHAFRFVGFEYWLQKLPNKVDRISMVLGGLTVPVQQFWKQ
ncbi:hypothetical protein BT96DRAFT_990907 [Gymnopus androsaceus JB14]|uniref:Uncharacterized protein n=1 Tax=Gymnopus androsaceus JB14 TaxID=1447944 RepID=A0A6A4HTY0_9AGAR|nr:hypothetical protein BT96DRAFT_990907 [Gymnopus androsaceus JB14]